MNYNRRQLFQNAGATGLLTGFASQWPLYAANSEPHYLMIVSTFGGCDASYLFDARPLSMTEHGLQHNYLGENPTKYDSANGGTCWRTKLTEPLKPWLDKLAIVNGVMMGADLEDHFQNFAVALTANPFGGPSYLGYWPGGETASLQIVENGGIISFLPSNNIGRRVSLGLESAESLRSMASNIDEAKFMDAFKFPSARTNKSAENGRNNSWQSSAKRMQHAFTTMPSLQKHLRGLPEKTELKPSDNPTEQDVLDELAALTKLYAGAMKSGLAPVSMIELTALLGRLGHVFDAHDLRTAKAQPVAIGAVAKSYKVILETLATTEFQNGKSMLDVTTVVFQSEFSRTMRQERNPIGETGTDHNSLTNTVLLAGKSIRGGIVLGNSDFQTHDEELSAAHMKVDARRVKIMGRPFDFATSESRQDQPNAFHMTDYLTMASVLNTLQYAGGIDSKHRYILGRGLPEAPIVSKLLR
jgi:hypothetical protein